MDFVMVSGIPSNTFFHQFIELVKENHTSLLRLPKFPLFCIGDICKYEELASLLICLSINEIITAALL